MEEGGELRESEVVQWRREAQREGLSVNPSQKNLLNSGTVMQCKKMTVHLLQSLILFLLLNKKINKKIQTPDTPSQQKYHCDGSAHLAAYDPLHFLIRGHGAAGQVRVGVADALGTGQVQTAGTSRRSGYGGVLHGHLVGLGASCSSRKQRMVSGTLASRTAALLRSDRAVAHL